MRTLHYLLLGTFFAVFGCSEDVTLSEDALTDISASKKGAEVVKTVTIPAVGEVYAIPNPDLPQITCVPADLEVTVASGGWCSGHCTMTGTIVQEESPYETFYCEFQMTPEGPVIYSETNVTVTGNAGDKKFLLAHTWINVVSGEVTGYSIMNGGTGRFEGASGRIDIANGSLDFETGIASWEDSGSYTIIVRD